MSAGVELRVAEQTLLSGCSAGLNEATALVTLDRRGRLDEAAERRLRAGVAGLVPGEPLYGIGAGDWPGAFVLPGEPEPLGQWVIALTIAIQRWARDPVFRGRVVSAEENTLRLAIPWRGEALFGDALGLALRLIGEWSRPVPDEAAVAAMTAALNDALPRAQQDGLAPSALRFARAAVERDIPFRVESNWVRLGWGAAAIRLDSTFTDRAAAIAAGTARNKVQAAMTLTEAGIPVPFGGVVGDLAQAEEAAAALGWPVVVKPASADQGAGVVPGISDLPTLHRACEQAAKYGGQVLIERHIPGDDHRLLVVHGRMLAAARRTAGGVTGDGVSTVEQLVEQVNADPRRGSDSRSQMRRLVFDAEALDCLAAQNLSTDSVPAPGRRVALRRTANISTGGSAVDVTADVHPENRMLAERAARIIGLDVAGVDFITTDISRSWRDVGGAVCEVNSQPGLRPHWLADPGRDINGDILDALLDGASARIPTAAITGTNGKTTTALMLHRIWTTAGACTGVCTTAGTSIGHDVIRDDNLSGFPGARLILGDPAVQAAVFEMPRKGLKIFGHPCDRYDVAALLNVTDDHLGEYGIDTLEQMAELKSEILQRASQAIVVNAEDPRCMAVRHLAGTRRHILVAGDPRAVAAHREAGGEAVFLAEHDGARWIMLADGAAQTPLMPAGEIPATMDGLLRFNETNAMFAAAMAWAQGIAPDTIRAALRTFANTVEQNPGRYNFLDGFPFTVLLDFAHNPDGAREVAAVAANTPVTGRRILCTRGLGSHSASHFAQAAGDLAHAFDEFLLGCVPQSVADSTDYAGDDPVGAMLSATRGLLLDNGVDAEKITTVRDPDDLLRAALDAARPGDLLVILAKPHTALPVIEDWSARHRLDDGMPGPGGDDAAHGEAR